MARRGTVVALCGSAAETEDALRLLGREFVFGVRAASPSALLAGIAAGDLVVVEPGWRADDGPCPARQRLIELLGEPAEER